MGCVASERKLPSLRTEAEIVGNPQTTRAHYVDWGLQQLFIHCVSKQAFNELLFRGDWIKTGASAISKNDVIPFSLQPAAFKTYNDKCFLFL